MNKIILFIIKICVLLLLLNLYIFAHETTHVQIFKYYGCDSEKLIDNNDFSSDEELITAILDKEKKEYVVIFDESNVGSFDIYEVKR